VPPEITRGKQVTVKATSQGLSVWAGDQKLLDGGLTKRVRYEETIWSLVPSKCIQVHLEKTEERWWDALLTSDEKINTRQIDPARPLNTYSEAEQTRIREMVMKEQERQVASMVSFLLAGFSCPVEVFGCIFKFIALFLLLQNTEDILKAAWDAEGSPFKGTPYDPSKVNF
jgi:CS domain